MSSQVSNQAPVPDFFNNLRSTVSNVWGALTGGGSNEGIPDPFAGSGSDAFDAAMGPRNVFGPLVNQQTGGSGGGTGGGGGFDFSSLSGSIDAQTGAQEGVAERDYETAQAQLDAEWNNVMDYLDTQVGNLQGQLPLDIAEIEAGYTGTKAELERNQQQNYQDIYQQGLDVREQGKSTVSDARKLYNELQTRVANYGGSVRDAMGELIGRETAGTIGKAMNFVGREVARLGKARQTVTQFYTDKLNELAQNRQLSIDRVRQAFQSEINNINASKRAARRDKAAAKTQALNNFRNQIAEIQQAGMVAKFELDKWAANRSSALDGSKKFITEIGTLLDNVRAQGYTLKEEGMRMITQWSQTPVRDLGMSLPEAAQQLAPYIVREGDEEDNDLNSTVNLLSGGTPSR